MKTSNEASLALACSGWGHVSRGYERFFDELGRRLEEQRPFVSFGGARSASTNVRVVPCLRRTSRVGRLLARCIGEFPAYSVEAITFGLVLFPILLRHGCRVVFVADHWTGRVLNALCWLLPRRRRLVILFHNGGPHRPKRIRWASLVQQLTEPMYEEALAKNLDQSRLLPIPVEPPPPDPAGVAAVRRDLNMGPADALVLSVGAHDPFKRLDRVLRAVATLPPEFLDRHALQVLIAGEDGPCTPSLRKLAGEVLRDRVHFRRYRPDEMSSVYGSARLALVPSNAEGFGLGLVEAMALGIPVVANDDERKRSIVGDGAILVDAEDAHALGAAIERLIEDPQLRESMAKKGRERVQARYSWGVLLPEYLEFLDEGAALAANLGSGIGTRMS